MRKSDPQISQVNSILRLGGMVAIKSKTPRL